MFETAEGYKKAIELFEGDEDSQENIHENRIIFLTDAMPNVGVTDSKSLLGMTKHYGERHKYKIYTSIIGVGIDFNTDLIEQITKVRGANYMAVHSNKEFKKKINEEFKYMVSPLVFNLNLDVSTEGNQFEIEEIYGSNEETENSNSANIMNVKSLFPSPVKENKEE